MYKISVPIKNDSVTEKNKHIYLKQLKESGVGRVFFTLSNFFKTEKEERDTLSSLSEKIKFFEENGIEACVWMGTTLGHGGSLPGADYKNSFPEYTRRVNFKGEALNDTRCPLHSEVRHRIANQIATLAKTGTKTVLLDDDFRMSMGNRNDSHCCACDLHIQRINEITGECHTAEELYSLVFRSPANKYRKAWLDSQGEGLRMLARDIRAAVDSVDPSVRVALCSTTAIWEEDGCDALELSKILAGKKNRPLVRMFSAPYQIYYSNRNLSTILDASRMAASFAQGCDVELMSEGDVFPRPRYHVPASYLEIYDAVMRVDGGFDGIFKYMVDYISSAEYETGYFEHHKANLKLMNDLEEMFRDKRCCGVKMCMKPHVTETADFSLSDTSYCYPCVMTKFATLGSAIPTTFTGDGICNVILGEYARQMADSEIGSSLVLDALSAIILKERGIDVGIEKIADFQNVAASRILNQDDSEIAYVARNQIRLLNCKICEKANAVEFCLINGEKRALAYTYENENGQRFLVYLYDAVASRNAELPVSYLHEDILLDKLEWITRGEKLPAVSSHNPWLYIMAKRGEASLAVALFNCYQDKVLNPIIKLEREYKHVRFINTAGELLGDTVKLSSPLPAFDFAAFEVYD